MSDDGARYLERVIKQRDEYHASLVKQSKFLHEVQNERDEWQRIANERAAELVTLYSALREIVFTLARRLRRASRDLRRVGRGKPGEYTVECVTYYKGAFMEARDAHEGARRTLRRNTRRTLERKT